MKGCISRIIFKKKLKKRENLVNENYNNFNISPFGVFHNNGH